MKRFFATFFYWFFRGLVFALIVAAFLGVPFTYWSVWSQRLAVALVLTVLFGRFFCAFLCPLGFVQDLVRIVRHPFAHVRRVCTRLPESRTQRIVRWTVAVLCAAGIALGFGSATIVLPMSVFGKALTLWTPGLVLMAVVFVLALIGDGRIWCNWVCPYGTVFTLLAKLSLRKNKVSTGCSNCRRCFGDSSTVVRVTHAHASPEDSPEGGLTRRETLKGVALLAVAEKMTDGGYAPVSLPGEPARTSPVLPPGAVDVTAFARKCVGCQLCVSRCLGGCLAPSTDLRRFGQPELRFQKGYCLVNCVTCVTVCPERALLPVQREQRPYVHMGVATWHKDLCLRTTQKENCTACVRKCPVRAIHLVKGFPVVDRDACIGCGACEHVCPARPMPAMQVDGLSEQRMVNPISEADLLAEMRTRLADGATLVLAKDGVITEVGRDRGVRPLLKLMDEGRLAGVVALDKVVGRAAASIYAVGGAKRVFTPLAAKGAAEILAKKGGALMADKTVEKIMNREKTDICPMEKASQGLEDSAAIVEKIRAALKK